MSKTLIQVGQVFSDDPLQSGSFVFGIAANRQAPEHQDGVVVREIRKWPGEFSDQGVDEWLARCSIRPPCSNEFRSPVVVTVVRVTVEGVGLRSVEEGYEFRLVPWLTPDEAASVVVVEKARRCQSWSVAAGVRCCTVEPPGRIQWVTFLPLTREQLIGNATAVPLDEFQTARDPIHVLRLCGGGSRAQSRPTVCRVHNRRDLTGEAASPLNRRVVRHNRVSPERSAGRGCRGHLPC